MDLEEFLVKAKIATYTSSGDEIGSVLDDGFKELTFETEGYVYRDRYLGFEPFIGQEIVLLDEKPIWGMNYYGKVLSSVVTTQETYEFLRKALRLVLPDSPFRGPKSFREGTFDYKSKSSGTLSDFRGIETISYIGKAIYKANYHGGSIEQI